MDPHRDTNTNEDHQPLHNNNDRVTDNNFRERSRLLEGGGGDGGGLSLLDTSLLSVESQPSLLTPAEILPDNTAESESAPVEDSANRNPTYTMPSSSQKVSSKTPSKNAAITTPSTINRTPKRRSTEGHASIITGQLLSPFSPLLQNKNQLQNHRDNEAEEQAAKTGGPTTPTAEKSHDNKQQQQDATGVTWAVPSYNDGDLSLQPCRKVSVVVRIAYQSNKVNQHGNNAGTDDSDDESTLRTQPSTDFSAAASPRNGGKRTPTKSKAQQLCLFPMVANDYDYFTSISNDGDGDQHQQQQQALSPTSATLQAATNSRDLVVVNPSAFGKFIPSEITMQTAKLVAQVANIESEDWARQYRFQQVIWPPEAVRSLTHLAHALANDLLLVPTNTTNTDPSDLDTTATSPAATSRIRTPKRNSKYSWNPPKSAKKKDKYSNPADHQQQQQNKQEDIVSRSRIVIGTGSSHDKIQTMFGRLKTTKSPPATTSMGKQELLEEYGLIGATANSMWQKLPRHTVCVLSVYEIVQEDEIHDLLVPSSLTTTAHSPTKQSSTKFSKPVSPKHTLHVRQPRDREGAIIEGLTECPVNSLESLRNCLTPILSSTSSSKGTPSKRTDKLLGNSPYKHTFQGGHLIVSLKIWHTAPQHNLQAQCATLTFLNLGLCQSSQLDGSTNGKRQSKANYSGPTIGRVLHKQSQPQSSLSSRQSSFLRKSASSLGGVLHGLLLQEFGSEAIIPYRDSILTKVLQRSLDHPESRAVVLASLSPLNDAYESTLATLRYVERLLTRTALPKSPFEKRTTHFSSPRHASPRSEGLWSPSSSVVPSPLSQPQFDMAQFADKDSILESIVTDPRQRLARFFKSQHLQSPAEGNDDNEHLAWETHDSSANYMRKDPANVHKKRAPATVHTEVPASAHTNAALEGGGLTPLARETHGAAAEQGSNYRKKDPASVHRKAAEVGGLTPLTWETHAPSGDTQTNYMNKDPATVHTEVPASVRTNAALEVRGLIPLAQETQGLSAEQGSNYMKKDPASVHRKAAEVGGLTPLAWDTHGSFGSQETNYVNKDPASAHTDATEERDFALLANYMTPQVSPLPTSRAKYPTSPDKVSMQSVPSLENAGTFESVVSELQTLSPTSDQQSSTSLTSARENAAILTENSSDWKSSPTSDQQGSASSTPAQSTNAPILTGSSSDWKLSPTSDQQGSASSTPGNTHAPSLMKENSDWKPPQSEQIQDHTSDLLLASIGTDNDPQSTDAYQTSPNFFQEITTLEKSVDGMKNTHFSLWQSSLSSICHLKDVQVSQEQALKDLLAQRDNALQAAMQNQEDLSKLSQKVEKQEEERDLELIALKELVISTEADRADVLKIAEEAIAAQDKLEYSVSELEQQLILNRNSSQALQEELETITQGKTEVTEELDTARIELSVLGSNLSELQTADAELQSQLENMKRDIVYLLRQRAEDEATIATLKQEIDWNAAKESDNEAQREKVVILQQENETLILDHEARESKLVEQLTAAVEHFKYCKAELEKTKGSLQVLQQQDIQAAATMEQEIGILRQENTQIKRALSSVQKEKGAFFAEQEDARDKHQAVATELENARENFGQRLSAMQELTWNLQEAKGDAAELRQQLAQKDRELEHFQQVTRQRISKDRDDRAVLLDKANEVNRTMTYGNERLHEVLLKVEAERDEALRLLESSQLETRQRISKDRDDRTNTLISDQMNEENRTLTHANETLQELLLKVKTERDEAVRILQNSQETSYKTQIQADTSKLRRHTKEEDRGQGQLQVEQTASYLQNYFGKGHDKFSDVGVEHMQPEGLQQTATHNGMKSPGALNRQAGVKGGDYVDKGGDESAAYAGGRLDFGLRAEEIAACIAYSSQKSVHQPRVRNFGDSSSLGQQGRPLPVVLQSEDQEMMIQALKRRVRVLAGALVIQGE